MKTIFNFLLYLLGFFFILGGFMTLTEGQTVPALFILSFGILLLPKVYQEVKQKFPKIKKLYYITLTIFTFIFGMISLGNKTLEEIENLKQTNSGVILSEINSGKIENNTGKIEETLNALIKRSSELIANGGINSIKAQIEINDKFINENGTLDTKKLNSLNSGLKGLLETLEKEEKEGKPEWLFTAFKDKLTDEVKEVYYVTSKNSVEQKFPYKTTNAQLVVRKSKSNLDVYIKIQSGQILTYNRTATLRFDDKKAFNVGINGSNDSDSTYGFLDSENKIFEELKKSKRLRIQIDLYQNGGVVFDFNTVGFKDALIKNKD
ncbi:hypothetical protein BKN14_00435 [Candidatus Gracilibacteria bacterium HOT-871]|nr:hypothetical protein BKN14_00435 [Candidatus Gracilibacteria bacterium HOT-871]